MIAFIRRIIKNYYRKKGYEIVLKKYKLIQGELPQSMVFPRATYSPWMGDEAFQNIYQKAKDNTLVDIYRCYELWQLAQEVKSIEGDYLEVGVWRGGTGVITAKSANLFSPDSKIYLCDTFEGVVKAGEHDNRYVGGEHADTSKSIVEALIKNCALTNVHLLQGMFPDDTGHLLNDNKIKFCHIDVDVYTGAKEITEWVWKRLSPGGIIVFDDFGFSGTQGVTKFVENERQKADRIVLHNLNGHGIIIKLK